MDKFEKNVDYYSQGYRFLLAIQYGPTYVLKENPGAKWGSGVYALNEDNTQGECVDWNYDSSG